MNRVDNINLFFDPTISGNFDVGGWGEEVADANAQRFSYAIHLSN